jgi:hypothetical protein
VHCRTSGSACEALACRFWRGAGISQNSIARGGGGRVTPRRQILFIRQAALLTRSGGIDLVPLPSQPRATQHSCVPSTRFCFLQERHLEGEDWWKRWGIPFLQRRAHFFFGSLISLPRYKTEHGWISDLRGCVARVLVVQPRQSSPKAKRFHKLGNLPCRREEYPLICGDKLILVADMADASNRCSLSSSKMLRILHFNPEGAQKYAAFGVHDKLD